MSWRWAVLPSLNLKWEDKNRIVQGGPGQHPDETQMKQASLNKEILPLALILGAVFLLFGFYSAGNLFSRNSRQKPMWEKASESNNSLTLWTYHKAGPKQFDYM